MKIKPLSFESFKQMILLQHFNEYHKTTFTSWESYFKDVSLADTTEKEYEDYLRWLEIKDTPLYQALKEDQ